MSDKPVLTEDDRYHIACKLSHDLREGLNHRVRWNNEAMLRAINTAEIASQQLEALQQRHAKLVRAVKVLKDWVDLPHSDQCSPEMNWAWELFCQIEREVSDE